MSPRQLQVGDDVLEAEKIFLNVGARPHIPDLAGAKTVPFLTSSTILELTEVPKHLIVVGGSYIGLEFGQMFRRFGAEGDDRRAQIADCWRGRMRTSRRRLRRF